RAHAGARGLRAADRRARHPHRRGTEALGAVRPPGGRALDNALTRAWQDSCAALGRPITPRVRHPRPRPRHRMAEGKPRILIVDDEPDLLTVLRFGLESEGFDVIQASDGEQGLALARQYLPDLMILDLMLPRMDGYKVCRALKFDERYKR